MGLRAPDGVTGQQNTCPLIHYYFSALMVWECILLSGRILALAGSMLHSDSGLRVPYPTG